MKLALPPNAECFLELQTHISELQRALKVLQVLWDGLGDLSCLPSAQGRSVFREKT